MIDWLAYLHLIRRREIERIVGKCLPRMLPVGLELGAGDGYQSSLLRAYDVDRLLARVMRGPVFSAYGSGWERLRRILECLALTSECAFIAVKHGQQGAYHREVTL